MLPGSGKKRIGDFGSGKKKLKADSWELEADESGENTWNCFMA